MVSSDGTIGSIGQPGDLARGEASTDSAEGTIDLARLQELIRRGDVETVIVAGVDVQGKLFGKRIHAPHFLAQGCRGTLACAAVLAWDTELSLVDGVGFCGWHTGYQDLLLRPDFSTTRLIPWFEKTALILSDAVQENGGHIAFAPRSVLKAQVDRAAAMGYTVYSASELEFHLLRETGETARAKGFVHLDLFHDYLADYNLYRSSRDEWFFRKVRAFMSAAGVPIESNKPEYGNGQAEVNMEYSLTLEAADRHAIYKHGVKEMAALDGFMITFMAKPFTEHSGSSCHTHMSLWQTDNGENAFWDGAEPHGMSKTMRHFLGGLQRLAPDFFLLYAPYVNSYKRFVPESFAPCRNAWGMDNRTVAFRVAGHGSSCRLENRIPGADVNGYFVKSAMLASGLYGIEHELEPLDGPARGNAYYGDAPLFPTDLVEALRSFEESTTTRELLGDSVVDDLASFARHELSRYFKEVTDWERRVYLELI